MEQQYAESTIRGHNNELCDSVSENCNLSCVLHREAAGNGTGHKLGLCRASPSLLGKSQAEEKLYGETWVKYDGMGERGGHSGARGERLLTIFKVERKKINESVTLKDGISQLAVLL